jgi:hypothetical protein
VSFWRGSSRGGTPLGLDSSSPQNPLYRSVVRRMQSYTTSSSTHQIHRELTSHVYPVEMVYGTVEVKGRLESRDLHKICEDIAKVRALGNHRYYLQYASVTKSQQQPDVKVVGWQELHSTGSPRAFVFAYEQRSWKDLSDFVASLKEAARSSPAHIHGLAVLSSDWYVTQEAFAPDPPQYRASEGDALLKLVNGMLHSIGSIEMLQMSIDRYYQHRDNV